MNYFYVLKSEKDNKYYYGSTDNLKRRIVEHQKGKVKSTKYRFPLDLVYYEAYKSISIARKRERQIKSSGSSRKVLLDRINNKGQ